MTREQIIRAWKDEEFRSTLSVGERSLLPENPAGVVLLSDDDLGKANGGGPVTQICSFICTTGIFCISYAAGGTCHGFTLGCCEV